MWWLVHFIQAFVRAFLWGRNWSSHIAHVVVNLLAAAVALGLADRALPMEHVRLWWGYRLMVDWVMPHAIGVAALGALALIAVGRAIEQTTGVRLRLGEIRQDHHGISRLRVFNDGRKVIPEVAVTRIMREDGSEPYRDDLEREIKWSHRADGDRPTLGSDIEGGLTVDAGEFQRMAVLPGPDQGVPTLCITAMNGAQLFVDAEIPPQERGKVWVEYTVRGFGGSGGKACSWYCLVPEIQDCVLRGYHYEDQPPPLPLRPSFVDRLTRRHRAEVASLGESQTRIACYAQVEVTTSPFGKRLVLLVKNLSRSSQIEQCTATLREFHRDFGVGYERLICREHTLLWEDGDGILHDRMNIPAAETARLRFAETGVDPSHLYDHGLCTLAGFDDPPITFGVGNPQSLNISGVVHFEAAGWAISPSSVPVIGGFADTGRTDDPSNLYLLTPPAPPANSGLIPNSYID